MGKALARQKGSRAQLCVFREVQCAAPNLRSILPGIGFPVGQGYTVLGSVLYIYRLCIRAVRQILGQRKGLKMRGLQADVRNAQSV